MYVFVQVYVFVCTPEPWFPTVWKAHSVPNFGLSLNDQCVHYVPGWEAKSVIWVLDWKPKKPWSSSFFGNYFVLSDEKLWVSGLQKW